MGPSAREFLNGFALVWPDAFKHVIVGFVLLPVSMLLYIDIAPMA